MHAIVGVYRTRAQRMHCYWSQHNVQSEYFPIIIPNIWLYKYSNRTTRSSHDATTQKASLARSSSCDGGRRRPQRHGPGPERPLHDDGELELLGEVHLLAVGLAPVELPHEVGHEVLEVQQRQRHAGADPAPGAERHHLDLLAAGEVHVVPLAAGQEPLRPELRGGPPHLLVHPDVPHREVDGRAGGHAVPVQRRVLVHGVREHVVARRVAPERLQHHGLEVRHRLQLLLQHLAVGAGAGAGHLVPEPVLHRRVLHQVRQDPLQRGGRRVGAGAEELGAEAHDLAVRQRPPAVLGNGHLHQGVDVAVPVAAGLPPGLYQRDEELLLPTPQRDELLPASAEHELGHPREEGEDLEAEEAAEELPLRGLDVPDARVVPEAVATEAHVDEEAEHGVLERLHDGDGSLPVAAVGADAAGEDAEHPPARGGEGPEPRRVEHPGGEVPAQRPPRGAVGGGADVAAAAGEHGAGGRGGRAGGERGAALHERAVRRAAVGHEDARARPPQRREREDLAVVPRDAAEDGLDVEVAAREEEQRAQHRQRRRARGQGRERGGGVGMPGLLAWCARPQNERAEEAEESGEGVEEPVLHGRAWGGGCPGFVVFNSARLGAASPEIITGRVFIAARDYVTWECLSRWEVGGWEWKQADDIFRRPVVSVEDMGLGRWGNLLTAGDVVVPVTGQVDYLVLTRSGFVFSVATKLHGWITTACANDYIQLSILYSEQRSLP
jgi:hypothetical protein